MAVTESSAKQNADDFIAMPLEQNHRVRRDSCTIA
jgi:hypothetical protein